MSSGKRGRPAGRERTTINAAIDIETKARIQAAADEDFTTTGVVAGAILDAHFAESDPAAPAEPTPKSRLAEAREREKAIDIEMKEMKLAKERKETLSVDQVIEFFERQVTTIRSRLVSIPTAMLGLTPEQTEDLEKQIADAMTDLTRGTERATWES